MAVHYCQSFLNAEQVIVQCGMVVVIVTVVTEIIVTVIVAIVNAVIVVSDIA